MAKRQEEIGARKENSAELYEDEIPRGQVAAFAK
jgi:hypothetical protein